MDGSVFSSGFKSDLKALSYHVNKGNFLSVKQSEPLFVKSVRALSPKKDAGKIESLKRVSWQWLKEIGTAIKEKDVSMLQQAYDEFMRVYELLENGGHRTLEDVIMEKKEPVVTTQENVSLVEIDGKVGKKENQNEILNISGDQYDLSFPDHLSNEEFCKKLDIDEANYYSAKSARAFTPRKESNEVTEINTNEDGNDQNNLSSLDSDSAKNTENVAPTKESKEVTDVTAQINLSSSLEPESDKNTMAVTPMKESKEVSDSNAKNKLSSLIPEYLRENLHEMVEKQVMIIVEQYVEGQLEEYDLGKILSLCKIDKSTGVANVPNNPYKKGHGKRKMDNYHNQMVGEVPVHGMKKRSAKRQSTGTK